jgi:hypothetical protein
METQLDRLEARLDKAEGQVFVLRVLLFVVFVAAVLLILVRPGATQSASSTVKAPFRVVDDNGKLLLKVGTDKGSTKLELFCPQSSRPVLVTVDKRGGGLVVMDETGRSAALLLAKSGGADLNLMTGKSLVTAGADGKGGHVQVVDPGSGRIAVQMGKNERGNFMGVCNDRATSVVEVRSGEDGGEMVLRNNDGNGAASVAAREYGGVVTVSNRAGETSGGLFMLQRSGCVAMFDKSGSK